MDGWGGWNSLMSLIQEQMRQSAVMAQDETAVHKKIDVLTYDIWCTFKHILNLYGPFKVRANCLTMIYKLYLFHTNDYAVCTKMA